MVLNRGHHDLRFRRNVLNVGSSTICDISSKPHSIPIAISPSIKRRKWGCWLSPPLPHKNESKYTKYLELLKKVVPCPLPTPPHTDPHAHYLLRPAGWHAMQLLGHIRVGWIQLQSCYIFLLLRIVLLKVVYSCFHCLSVCMGLQVFLGSRISRTKSRTVLGKLGRLATLLVEIREQNDLASVTKPQFIWGAVFQEIKGGRFEL